MSQHDPAYWMVCYDIADQRRGQRVLKFFKRCGVPVQYSVFLVHASPAAMHQLMREVEQLIARSHDDVRAYRIPAAVELHHLGAGIMPRDVLVGVPAVGGAAATAARPQALPCPAFAGIG